MRRASPAPPPPSHALSPPSVQARERVEAMSVFKAFVRTAQEDWLATESARKPWLAKYKVRVGLV